MEKVLDLKMPGVQELELEELREVEGGFVLGIIIWAAGSLASSMIADSSGGSGVSEEDYAFWYEGISGLPYEGWEGGYN